MAVDPIELSNPDLPKDQRPTFRKLMDHGVTAYERILELLSPYISPEEASIAEAETRRAIRALFWALSSLALFACTPSTTPFKDDILSAASLLAALVLTSRYRIFFAGRLILIPVALMTFHLPSYADWAPLSDALKSLDVLSVALALAWLIDYGANTEPDRTRPTLRRLALVLAGAGVGVATWDKFPVTFGAGLIAAVWGWWPAPFLEQRARLGKSDSETLWLLAMRRWSFVTSGRVFAIAIGLIPFFLFLHSLNLEGRLHLPEDDPEIVRSKSGTTTYAWFWQLRGSFLRETDLRRDLFYGLEEGERQDIVEELRVELADAKRGLPGRRPEAIYGDIKKALEGSRIQTIAKFNEIQSSDQFFTLYYLEEPKQPSRSLSRKFLGMTYLAIDLSSSFGSPLVPQTDQDIANLLAHNDIWRWLLLGYGLLGFAILWRRGGDSRLGRWLGVWFIGVGTVGMIRYKDFFLPALNYQVSHHADLSTETLINLMVLCALVVVALFMLFVPCAAVWTHACWPSRRPDGPRRFLRKLALAYKIILVTGFMSGLFYVPWLIEPDNPYFLTIWGITVVPCVGLGLGVILRRQIACREFRIPINISAGFVMLCVQSVVVTTVWMEHLNSNPGAARLLSEDLYVPQQTVDHLKYGSLLAGLVFLCFIVILIFTKDFLHLSAVRDVSLVVTAMVVPALLAWSEELSSSYVSLFAENLISTRGKEILAMVLALGLLPPFRRWLEHRILYATQRGLKDVAEQIHTTMESLEDLWGPDSLARIEALLCEIGLSHSMLYVRRGKDFFAAQKDSSGAARSVQVSRSLRMFLTGKPDFLDLGRIAYEWRYFFVQFELHKFQKATQGRFLLPISLSGSMLAFIVVPDDKVQRAFGALPAHDIGQLGLILARTSSS